jgi:hypothetical protein
LGLTAPVLPVLVPVLVPVVPVVVAHCDSDNCDSV